MLTIQPAKRLAIACAAFLACSACATTAAQRLNVSVMVMGARHPERPGNCTLQVIDGQPDPRKYGLMPMAMLTVSGRADDLRQVAAQLPDAVATAACKLGGTAVGLSAAIATAAHGAVQYTVWWSEADVQEAPKKAKETLTM